MRTARIEQHPFVFSLAMSSSRSKSGSLDEQKAWSQYFAYLIKTLADPDAGVRARAARILGENREPQAIGALASLLMDDPDMRVRREAALALGRLGAVESLVDGLQVPDMPVRLLITQVLGTLGDPRAIKPLIIALRDTHAEVRSQAAFALTKIGEPAVEPLLLTLRHADPVARWSAARVLGSLGDPRAVPALERLLDDDTPVPAARTTGELRATRPIQTVGQAARQALEHIRQRS
jgi:hypothetical protein